MDWKYRFIYYVVFGREKSSFILVMCSTALMYLEGNKITITFILFLSTYIKQAKKHTF